MKITKKFAFQHLEARIAVGGPYASKPRSMEYPEGQCVYNPKVNGGCAIGAHLGDLYRPWMDHDSVTVNSLFTHPEIAERFEEPLSEFWNQLQQAHDAAARGRTVERDRRLARAWDLV